MSDTNNENAPSMLDRLSRAVQDIEANQDREGVENDADDTAEQTGIPLAEWQATVESANPTVQRLSVAYPQWLSESFGERVLFRGRQNQGFSVFFDGRRIQRGHFNQTGGLYIWLQNPASDEIALLEQLLPDATTLRARSRHGVAGYRFVVSNDEEYAALQRVTSQMIARLSGNDQDWPPEPLDGPAFVLIHKNYGPIYDFDRDAGGASVQLITALENFQQRGTPVYAILYRPYPYIAFTAWTKVRSASIDENDHWTVHFDFHEFPVALSLKNNAKQLQTTLPWLAKGLNTAFRGISIRPLPSEQMHTILDMARSVAQKDTPMNFADAAFTILSRAGGGPLRLNAILEQAQQQGLIETKGQTPSLSLSSAMLRDERFVNLGKNTWVLAPPSGEEDDPDTSTPEVAPVLVGQDTGLWRIHMPRELWEEAYTNRVVGVGFLDNPTSQSVQRFRRIKVGDRVVIYIQNGVIGGVGVVTRPFRDGDESSAEATRLFGGKYSKQISVNWSERPSEPVDILAHLKQSAHTNLYNRIKNPHTVMPLGQDDYETILELIGGVDPVAAPRETRLPAAWSNLSTYRDLVAQLAERGYTGEELLEVARTLDTSLNTTTDAADLIDELRQLRLLRSIDADRYQRQNYTAGDQAALLRLMALSLLVPIEGSAEIYTLPAREIITRERTSQNAQQIDDFAPQLGADRHQLLAWYQEAELVVVNDDTWRWADDAFAPLSNDDAATATYNAFLVALLAEIDGALVTDMTHASGPLTPVADVQDRLNELGDELLIDPLIVDRIHRSLVAGRHIVLSGPPGTGKTELARRLPSLLWREAAQQFTRLPRELDAPPVETRTVQRQGYAPIVVTATEDWGVRDVVGGIGPRLDGEKGALSYDIQYGVLTRVLLLHYDGSDNGRRLPAQLQSLNRRDYLHSDKERYRGAWLVIDEFTRAPVDAAFGSLLTTLSGSAQAHLAVPTGSGPEVSLPLPADFRIIGTLNSFDRHFLNQMSEALKRRFDFIDVLPPPPTYAAYEQGIAGRQALRRLQANGFAQIMSEGDPPTYRWNGVLEVAPATDAKGMQRAELRGLHDDSRTAIDSFWRLFSAIRVFRQLGTAQAVAVYTNLFAGALIGMAWPIALDSALADSLADQLQVMSRDEQRVIDAYVEHAGNAAAFAAALRAILGDLPPSRRPAMLHTLREADQLQAGSSDISMDEKQLTEAQITRIFKPEQALALPTPSIFRKRLRDLIGERGL